MKTLIKYLFIVVMLFIVSIGQVAAQVYINGQIYQGASLIQLQQQYGDVIPPGNYWLLQNGNWGYAGSSQVQGNFYTDNSGVGSSQGGGSSYYSPGGAGGYGSYASDGKCSYFSSGGLSINTCDKNW